MIEKIVLDYLTSELSVPVYMERPEHVPEKYVIVEKTGSGKSNRINSANIVVQSHASTLYDCATLNEQVKSAMEGITILSYVYSCKLNSDYNYTNTTDETYRYQAVFDLLF